MQCVKAFLPFLLVLAGPQPSQAYSVLDGTQAGFSSAQIEVLLSRVAETFTDPLFVEFRRLQQGRFPGVICGEVDGRDTFGGEVGFLPFYVAESGAWLIGAEERAWRTMCP